MILTKDGIKKDLISPKVIERWKRFGWVDIEDCAEIESATTEPRKRGRPARKED